MASCIPTLKPIFQLFQKKQTSQPLSASYFFPPDPPDSRSHRSSSFSGEIHRMKELAPSHASETNAQGEDRSLPLPSESGDERSLIR
ncbi:hypothetical protein AJ78_03264 [Emergomyces pasteurianus Ep9510]|uniref:Uncharacterized protein n=1 Tax=Emergomyces pasteurianus Ep9510 TaxID=1447872 RepID=A0A1J9QMX2_9EURO|nr:hypothetical protein AJ78_03264 [Emergomyces pasteurianus Ep9510]